MSKADPARRLPRSARRAQLLAAAQEVFVAQGYHATLMDEIAERAGVSKPVLYRHFPSKHELYLALLDESVNDLVGRVRTALATSQDNKTRVLACFAAYFDFVDHDGAAYRLVFESDLRNEPTVRARVDDMLASCVDAIADTIASDTGLADEEARLLSVGLAGLAEVSARWWLDEKGKVPKERAIELLAGLAWRGVSANPRHG